MNPSLCVPAGSPLSITHDAVLGWLILACGSWIPLERLTARQLRRIRMNIESKEGVIQYEGNNSSFVDLASSTFLPEFFDFYEEIFCSPEDGEGTDEKGE